MYLGLAISADGGTIAACGSSRPDIALGNNTASAVLSSTCDLRDESMRCSVSDEHSVTRHARGSCFT
jgi:hypothetical protein